MRRMIDLFIFGLICLVSTIIVDAANAQGDPNSAALNCTQNSQDFSAFADCWNNEMMSSQQHVIASCYEAAQSGGSFATCAHGVNLSNDEVIVANCATRFGFNQLGAFFACIGANNLSPEQQRIANCVGQHPQDVWLASACMAGHFMSPEQQVIAACAIETGMTPLPLAYCVGGQLTINELDKCVTIGIGGNGCFGTNNTVVQVVQAAWRGISGGPNSVFNNPAQVLGGPNSIFNNPGQVWGGPNSVFNNPGQIWGGPNSVVNNPSQIWGGSNSVFNNPGQLLHW